MKKIFLAFFIFYACASTPAAPDDLDIAIRDTSDYLNDNIPKGNKIVILNIQSDHAALSEYIIDELIANAVNDKVFSVVDRAQLDQIRMELNFQLSGEVSDQSALEIGKFFGAQTIVSGAISELADKGVKCGNRRSAGAVQPQHSGQQTVSRIDERGIVFFNFIRYLPTGEQNLKQWNNKQQWTHNDTSNTSGNTPTSRSEKRHLYNVAAPTRNAVRITG